MIDIKDVSYGVGMSIAGSLMQQNLQGISPQVLAEAITDVFEGKQPKLTPDQANQAIQSYLKEVVDKKFQANKQAGEAFLAENSKKEGVKTTVSGLQYEVLNEGAGKSPASTDQVTVHYHGTLIDGTVFDSSIERNSPATFGVNQVIKGWTEALQLMKEGDKFRLYIPQELAYGDQPHPGGPIEPYMALIFDVELISVN
ncbi:MAG: FKBP-type peptidyl-prolyl cis-trans isomerase [Crocinitomicaceae bacterium]|jgi:FKBP-type peptidyl-prolyl cis-trans isomerase FklB|nr:FKBP-type peptidyl-prolyl cis-trans isomerase [Crocinitomicaceae bacterium]